MRFQSKVIHVVGVGLLVIATAIAMEVNVLNPASAGGSWAIFLWVPATIVWAVGSLRNHPIRSTRDIIVFTTAVLVVGLLINLGTVGGMVLLTGMGIGKLLSTFGRISVVPNPYRNVVCRILIGVSGTSMLAHTLRVVYFAFIAGG
jgi:hypothetical protein